MKNNQISDFPAHIIKKMLDYQEEQGNPRDIEVFAKDKGADYFNKGFDWHKTKEGTSVWSKVIDYEGFHLIPNNNVYPKLMEIRIDSLWQKKLVVFERLVNDKIYYYYVPDEDSPFLNFTNSVREINERYFIYSAIYFNDNGIQLTSTFWVSSKTFPKKAELENLVKTNNPTATYITILSCQEVSKELLDTFISEDEKD